MFCKNIENVIIVLLVSTLAIHGKYIPTDGTARHNCDGKTFCDQKPADYPQGAIDWLLMRNLTRHHRMRREIVKHLPEIEAGSTDGNCVVERKMITPYKLTAEGQVPQILVQSQFFSQQIPEVTCKSPDSPCFNAFIRDGSGIAAQCKPKLISAKLYVYDTKDNEVIPIDAEIPIDCVCSNV